MECLKTISPSFIYIFVDIYGNIYRIRFVNFYVDEVISMDSLMDPKELKRKIMEDPELLRKTIKENPALLDYIFSDAEIRRKYVKVPAEVEEQLKKTADNSGVAEGVLIGLGIALLLWLLFGGKGK